MEASVDSGRGVSLLCCEKLDSCQAYPDPKLLRDERILRNLLEFEESYRPKTDYFASLQSDIKPHMRKIVADWMLEVCEEQDCPEDLFTLAINLMDRFLCTTAILKTQFQLLGTTCLYIASKLKMTRPLSAQDLVIYTDHSITLEELKSWELIVLAKLCWDVNAVTGHDFVDYMIHRLGLVVNPAQVRTHAQVFISLCATDHRFARLPASLIAASSIGAAAHGLYYTRSTSSPVSSEAVRNHNNNNNNNNLHAEKLRRRSCHEEEEDEDDEQEEEDDDEENESMDFEDEETVVVAAAAAAETDVRGRRTTTTSSLDDSGTCSNHDHDYYYDGSGVGQPRRRRDRGDVRSRSRSNRRRRRTSPRPASPSPQQYLEDLLLQLQQITSVSVDVLRSCVEQIEQLVRLRLSAENGQKQPQQDVQPAHHNHHHSHHVHHQKTMPACNNNLHEETQIQGI